MKQSSSKVMRLINNPIVRRVGAWLMPIVIGYVTRKLTQKSSGQSKLQRKHVKNKAK